MFNPSKAAYNAALAAARLSVATALSIRKSLVAEDSTIGGSSVGHLEAAEKSLFTARTFDGYTGDLASAENPYRSNRTRRTRRPGARRRTGTAGRV